MMSSGSTRSGSMSSKQARVLWAAVVICACGTWAARGQGCPGSPNQSHGPDVVVANVTGPSNYPVSGTRAALALGSDACNLGDVEVHWEACPETTHPVFGGNLYRWSTVNGATRF